jgi:hypothetical protein
MRHLGTLRATSKRCGEKIKLLDVVVNVPKDAGNAARRTGN